MATNYAKPGSSIWAKAIRITPLDSLGNLIAGVSTLVTDTMVKLTITPVMEAGDQVAVKNAGGDLSTWAKHGDIIKWYTLLIELAIPDPQLEAAIAGGVVFSDSGAALGLVTGLAATAYNSGGTLGAGTWGYRVSQYNSYGQTVASTEVTATTTGTGQVYLSGWTLVAGALGVVIYGRTIGGEQKIGQMLNIGAQTTSAASGTGAGVVTLPVTALTQPVPAGFTFTIAGDTNAVKIVFTTTAAAGIGAVVLAVTTSISITTTIAAGAIVPTFVDTGVVVPSGAMVSVDGTAGPGVGVGYQTPATGSVGTRTGVTCTRWRRTSIRCLVTSRTRTSRASSRAMRSRIRTSALALTERGTSTRRRSTNARWNQDSSYRHRRLRPKALSTNR
jgi:hypothetical protein